MRQTSKWCCADAKFIDSMPRFLCRSARLAGHEQCRRAAAAEGHAAELTRRMSVEASSNIAIFAWSPSFLLSSRRVLLLRRVSQLADSISKP